MRHSAGITAIASRNWLRPLAVAVASLTTLLLSSCDRATIGPAAQAQVAPVSDAPPAAVSFSGRVVGIADGDTITVLVGGDREVKVRFAEIDAPEKAQPWGNRSKQTLSDLVFRRDVSVQQTDTDRWGRVVGRVFVEGRDINREMVALGAAWAYRQYLTDRTFIDVEARAKRGRVGLWSMPEAQTVPPWDWRRGERAGAVSQAEPVVQSRPQGLLSSPNATGGAGSFSCGSKTRCGQMTSCAEAQFYLTQCRVNSLDGNADGEPCEQLCGTSS